MRTDIKTHGPLATHIALWVAMLSPLLGVILGILGAWFLSLQTH